MIPKREFSIKYKSEIFLSFLQAKNESSKRAKNERRKIEDTMRSGKIKNFRFSIFNNESKIFEQRQNNIVAMEKESVCFLK